MDNSAIMRDEIIDTDADTEAKSNNKEIKTVPKNVSKKYNLQNTKFPYFTCFFINF